jgi:uncharacterized protein (TIGR00297 family)
VWFRHKWFTPAHALSYMILITLDLLSMPQGWWGDTPYRLAVVLCLTGGFALLGYRVHGVTRAGAVAGAVVCLVLLASVGPGAFVTLFALFAVTWIATRLGRARKQRLGTAERREGRSASQVLANLGVAAVCALLYSLRNDALFAGAMAAALSEAAADTVSSELGQACSEQARLITTFQQVPAGTDGGITWWGTLAGVLAAFGIGLTAAGVGVVAGRQIWMIGSAATLGMLADSYLGAWLERRGRLGNDVVNFVSTWVAAALAAVAIRLVH